MLNGENTIETHWNILIKNLNLLVSDSDEFILSKDNQNIDVITSLLREFVSKRDFTNNYIRLVVNLRFTTKNLPQVYYISKSGHKTVRSRR